MTLPAFAIGSSPLARGTGCREADRLSSARFIPAGAGNRDLFGVRVQLEAVHPRWRGEQARQWSAMRYPGGSSPLARGTEPIGPAGYPRLRFIPAGAGNSENRGVGEGIWRGSSPLARGTAGHRAVQRARQRFIPAGAGNSAAGSSAVFLSAVHPRWRGEQPPHAPPPAQLNGSSPLARGTAN